MATKSKTKSSETKTTTTRKGSGIGYVMNLASYIAVCFGGLALFISFILGKIGLSTSITSAMQMIANTIGWAVLCVMSAFYITKRRKIWMWVVWAIAVVMIVVGVIC